MKKLVLGSIFALALMTGAKANALTDCDTGYQAYLSWEVGIGGVPYLQPKATGCGSTYRISWTMYLAININ